MTKITKKTKLLVLALLMFLGLGLVLAWQDTVKKTSVPSSVLVNPKPITDTTETSVTPTPIPVKLVIESLGNQNNKQTLYGLYLKSTPITYSALSLRLSVEEGYKPASASVKPFKLSEKLAEAGVTDHINKWSCQPKQPCFVEIALLSLKPEGFTLNSDEPLGSIMFNESSKLSSITLDQTATQGLTKSGDVISIRIE